MRVLSLLLLTVVTLGCGSGMTKNGGSDPRPVAAFPIIPAISQLTPATTPTNSVPFLLTVNGSNFGTDAVAFWSGVAQKTSFISPQQLIVQITATDLQFAGVVPVYVRSGGLNSNTVDFNVTIQ